MEGLIVGVIILILLLFSSVGFLATGFDSVRLSDAGYEDEHCEHWR